MWVTLHPRVSTCLPLSRHLKGSQHADHAKRASFLQCSSHLRHVAHPGPGHPGPPVPRAISPFLFLSLSMFSRCLNASKKFLYETFMNSSSQSPPLHNGSKAQVKLRTIKLFTAALSEQIATQNSKLQPSRET